MSTMASSYSTLFFTFPFICLCFISFSLTEAANGGFSIDLIHRDSVKSPYYEPTDDPFRHVTQALRRSIRRASHFFPAAATTNAGGTPQAEVTPNGGEYLMSYSIGTPAFKVLGIADTGSDLIWLQCKPCSECYNQTAPLFDPANSNTYKTVPCGSKQCQSLDHTSCNDSICQYEVQYGDRSYSIGDLALDTLTLSSSNGRPVAFPKTLFGCGHENDGTFDSKGSGIIGLGGGAVSLVSQMNSSTGGKFSYCLVPYFSQDQASSKLNFGENALVSGPGTLSTPIVTGDPDTFYYLTLKAMSVGSQRIEFEDSSATAATEGNIIIDSGTVLTLLPEEFYTKLESEVAAQMKLERTDDPSGVLGLCYKYTEASGIYSLKAPNVTAHFDGADVTLNPINTFVMVAEEVACFAFSSISGGAIFGNVAQMNFLVGYDVQKKTLSFKPQDCSKIA